MKVKTLDMKLTYEGGVTEFDLVKKALKSDKKYAKDLVYRGFDGDNIPQLLKEGQERYRKSERDEFSELLDEDQDNADEEPLFAYTEKEILEETSSNIDIFAYASDFIHPAIAVLDSKCLKREDKNSYSYIFKNPTKKLEALVAVYRLKYPN